MIIYISNYDERDRTDKLGGSLSLLSHLDTQLLKDDKINEVDGALAHVGIHISKVRQLYILILRILGSAYIITFMN